MNFTSDLKYLQYIIKLHRKKYTNNYKKYKNNYKIKVYKVFDFLYIIINNKIYIIQNLNILNQFTILLNLLNQFNINANTDDLIQNILICIQQINNIQNDFNQQQINILNTANKQKQNISKSQYNIGG